MKTGFVSIKSKLLFLFIVFSVIPMGFVATHVYRHAEQQIRATTLQHLEELAKLKAIEIDRFFELARINLISAQDFVLFKSNIPILNRLAAKKTDRRYQNAKKMLDLQLVKFAEDHRITDIDIIGLDGTVIYSTDNDHPENESFANKTFFKEGNKGIYFSDIQRAKGKTPHYFLLASAPLYDLNNRLIGVIAFNITMNSFFAQIQGSTGLGASGEALLGKRTHDNSIVFLNPLRHEPDAALRKIVRVGDKNAFAIQQAASGRKGSGITTDYRGIEVVAAWRYIPTVKWGIVTKIDAAEALAPIIKLRRDLMAAGTLALFLGILFSLGLAHSMAQPMRLLKAGAEQLGYGNLDYRIPITSHDEIGALAGAFNRMAGNLKELTESREQIRHQANHDPLTGLPNRLLLVDRLEQALSESKREGRMMGVMFLDLDGFKGVNDAYGHDVGDLLLKEVASRLCYCVRQSDTVARTGGDEFVIVLLKIKEIDNIRGIAKKILKTIKEDFHLSGITIQIGASIGASVFPRDGLRPEGLMQLADEAMYRAKNAGKNTFRMTVADKEPETEVTYYAAQ